MQCGFSFCSPCASIHCSEIHRSWIFFRSTWQRPRTWPETTTSAEPEALPWLLGVCRVSAPPLFFWSCLMCFPLLISGSAPPPHPKRWTGGTGNTKTHWDEGGHGARRSERFTPRPRLYCTWWFTASPQCKAGFEAATLRLFFYRTVRCLQSGQVFLEGS